jgi:hypothetical protein
LFNILGLVIVDILRGMSVDTLTDDLCMEFYHKFQSSGYDNVAEFMFDLPLIKFIKHLSTAFIEKTKQMIKQWGQQYRMIAVISAMTRNYYIQNENTTIETASQCVNQWKHAIENKINTNNALKNHIEQKKRIRMQTSLAY